MQRPWRGAAYWLAFHGLLSLLSYRAQDHQPRSGIAIVSRACIHIYRPETLLQTQPLVSLVGAFSRGSLFQNESSRCQVDIKRASTQVKDCVLEHRHETDKEEKFIWLIVLVCNEGDK